MIKLCMISSIDRGDSLKLDTTDFNRAFAWLQAAEIAMPTIFESGSTSPDGAAMDDIEHFVKQQGANGILSQRVMNYARNKMPIHAAKQVLELMELSGILKIKGYNKEGIKIYITPSAG